jgi:RNA polymerase sigma-70 factor (ECF subfamily)
MKGMQAVATLATAIPEDGADRLAILFDTHYDRLYTLARRLAPDTSAAQDLVQDTFLKAARSLRAVPTVAPDEEAWLVRVLINVRRDEWRKEAVRKRHDPQFVTEAVVEAHQESALVARTTIWRALDVLAPRRRAVIVMHDLEGMDVPAIARLLGVSAITIRWHLSVGRRELARAFTLQTGEST